jgi:hypothetical protein
MSYHGLDYFWPWFKHRFFSGPSSTSVLVIIVFFPSTFSFHRGGILGINHEGNSHAADSARRRTCFRLGYKSGETSDKLDPFEDDEECPLDDIVPEYPDAIPSFHTAHGILCPHTVARMEKNTNGGRDEEAVKQFLDRYHHCGPMSCIDMLSDPEVLPHLTKAMRDLYS